MKSDCFTKRVRNISLGSSFFLTYKDPISGFQLCYWFLIKSKEILIRLCVVFIFPELLKVLCSEISLFKLRLKSEPGSDRRARLRARKSARGLTLRSSASRSFFALAPTHSRLTRPRQLISRVPCYVCFFLKVRIINALIERVFENCPWDLNLLVF